MAQPKRVGHLVVNVSDQDASTKFYTEVLGFEIAVERPGFGTFLTCGKIHHDLARLAPAPSDPASRTRAPVVAASTSSSPALAPRASTLAARKPFEATLIRRSSGPYTIVPAVVTP